ncbi:hypothetical protein [Micromonospora parathelypteridis]|uniref:Uncharacterized protein n=1 Tax=Micromonospora parathelypteridis TaxID=1839617 RepID=A0A840VTN9_9ACTN|nr:hypothetical protein [Micromonospora parathelypteridis]MBB5475940.1 hypothetical protein [Micromonospora parathelypteridis]GGO32107.1 hypothetical protein GCM10011576_61970 [Micromonospora parathelypteridis]
MSSDDLERRYRRLLAVYPWEHRRAYEDEMLAVLVAGARPGQRRPAAGDAMNLVGAGLRARLRVGARGFTGSTWADAAAVTGLLVASILLALAGKSLLNQLIRDPSLPPGYGPGGPDVVDWLRVAGWAGVCVAVLVGWRWLAAGLAWAGAIGWGALVAPQAGDDLTYVVDTLPRIALAVVAAAALTVPVPRHRTIALLGVRRLAALLLAPAVMAGLLEINRVTSPTFNLVGAVSYEAFYGIEASSELVLWLYVAVLTAVALTMLVALVRLDPGVRRRIVVMLLPVAALALVIDNALAGWSTSTMHMGHVIPLVPAQWAMLMLVPPVTFLAGALLVRRREETMRMVALGRAADREQPVGQ